MNTDAHFISIATNRSMLLFRHKPCDPSVLSRIWTFLQLTKEPVQLDHVQLEVVDKTGHIEEMAHQGHQAVTYSTRIQIKTKIGF